mmetsp:Transcript_19121/g.32134  ORF Transcript_19121/g.32134 Transcript_19121/m.32134 type:complete len:238 (-) Transcript_19121:832-1545(-)
MGAEDTCGVLQSVERKRGCPPSEHAHVVEHRRRVVPHLLHLHRNATISLLQRRLQLILHRVDAPALHLLRRGRLHQNFLNVPEGGGGWMVGRDERDDVAHLVGVAPAEVGDDLLGGEVELLLEVEVLGALLQVEDADVALGDALLDHALHGHVRDALHLGDVDEVLEGDGVEGQLDHRHLRGWVHSLLDERLQPAGEHLHELGLADARAPMQVKGQLSALREERGRLMLHPHLQVFQ